MEVNWLALAVMIGIGLVIAYFTDRYYKQKDEEWRRYLEEYDRRRKEGKE